MIVSGQTSVLLSLLMLSLVLADGGQKTPAPVDTKDEENLFIPTFFDFKKEIESIFPTQTERSVSEEREQSPDYMLEDGVSLERDYDFYSDVEGSESEMAPVTARAGYSPRVSQTAHSRQDYDYYEYEEEADSRDYGHHGSYSGGGGGHGHGGYGGYKVQPKKPGPYGYPSPNFKCEKSSETLYVTETEMTYDKKCYNVYKVKCQDGYDEGKGIGYQKHCNEFTVTRCRTVYDTSSEERCWTVYKKQCDMIYETMVDYEYEQKCTTSYEEECHGYGYHQECEKVPKEHCKQVPKKVEKQVPRTKCKKVPDKRCQDFPINVPRKECKEFPKTVCTQDPVNVKKKIPKKVCVQIPKEVCNTIPRVIVKEVPKKVGKKVCHSTKHSSYGHSSSSYQEPSYESSYGKTSSYDQPAPSYQPPDDYGAPKAPVSEYGTPAATNYGYKRMVSQRRLSSPSRPSYRDNWALGPG